jgi:hypothetical protein
LTIPERAFAAHHLEGFHTSVRAVLAVRI